MPKDLFTNDATAIVTSGGTDAPAAGTVETLVVSSATLLPAASSSAGTQFRIVDLNDGQQPHEVMIVTNVSGTSLTVTRGAEGTTPVAHAANWTATHTLTAGAIAPQLFGAGTSPSVVQAFATDTGQGSGGYGTSATLTATLPSEPTAGNTLLVFVTYQVSTTLTPPAGFALLPSTNGSSNPIADGSSGALAVYSKVSNGAEQSTTWTVSAADRWAIVVFEVAAVGSILAQFNAQASQTPTSSALTPTLVGGLVFAGLETSGTTATTAPAPTGVGTIYKSDSTNVNQALSISAWGPAFSTLTTLDAAWSLSASDSCAMGLVVVEPASVNYTSVGTAAGTLAAGNDSRFTTEAASVETANYTLALTDLATTVEMNSSSAVTVTVPPNSSVAFPVGAIVDVLQYGAGQVTIAGGTGVTVRTPSSLTTRAQYSTLTLRQRAVNEWVLGGDMT